MVFAISPERQAGAEISVRPYLKSLLPKTTLNCHRIIMANLAGTLIVDGIGVGLAAFGLLNPLLAAFVHVASELAFILNSARLLPRRITPKVV
jgi:cation transport ATPase